MNRNTMKRWFEQLDGATDTIARIGNHINKVDTEKIIDMIEENLLMPLEIELNPPEKMEE